MTNSLRLLLGILAFGLIAVVTQPPRWQLAVIVIGGLGALVAGWMAYRDS